MPISPNGWKQAYKDEDVTAPVKKPSLRTQREMIAGRLSSGRSHYREYSTPDVYRQIVQWHDEVIRLLEQGADNARARGVQEARGAGGSR